MISVYVDENFDHSGMTGAENSERVQGVANTVFIPAN